MKIKKAAIAALLAMPVAASPIAGNAWGENRPIGTSEICPNVSGTVSENLLGDQVRLTQTGKDRYDAFFLQAARVYGVLLLTDSLTAQFGQSLGVMVKDGSQLGSIDQWPEVIDKMGGSDQYSQGDADQLALRASSLEAVLPCLTSLSADVPSLISQGSSLISSASEDFGGWRNALKLPGVLSGLKTSITQLEQAARTSASMVSNVQSLISAAKAFQGKSSPSASEPNVNPDSPDVPDESAGEEVGENSTYDSSVPWFWSVAGVSSSGIRLDSGGSSALLGRQLIVIAMGDPIRDSETDRPLVFETRNIGRVEITHVNDSVIAAKPVGNCERIQVGDIVVLPALPAQAQE